MGRRSSGGGSAGVLKIVHAPILRCVFFRTRAGSEPVRRWLRDEIPAAARKTVGADIKTVQARWPIGRPLVASLGGGLWEVRSSHDKVEYRVVFMLQGATMLLLNGFEKRTRRTPRAALDLARARASEAT